jgi:FKBP-type peptidyl-prolyl cis-trans isomerase FklB
MHYSKKFVLAAMLPTLFTSQLVFAASNAPSSEVDKISYSLGVKTGENFSAQKININPEQFARGLEDTLKKQKIALSSEEMNKVITKFQEEQIALISKREKKMASDNLAKSKAFLDANKKQSGVKTLTSGLQYIELTPGKGNSPKLTDMVTVNYRGTLINGTEFDSSYNRKEANTFPLDNLIPGWQEALQLMKPGAKWKIFVPPQLAYGAQGAGQVIEPNSALIFEIELVNVKSGGQ